jgi:hypothetical protein
VGGRPQVVPPRSLLGACLRLVTQTASDDFAVRGLEVEAELARVILADLELGRHRVLSLGLGAVFGDAINVDGSALRLCRRSAVERSSDRPAQRDNFRTAATSPAPGAGTEFS